MYKFDLKKIKTFDKASLQKACEELYIRYHQDFEAFCRRFNADRLKGLPQMEPDDVFSEAFARLWTKIQEGTFTGEKLTCPLYYYFKKIGRNVMMEHVRKHVVLEAMEKGENSVNPALEKRLVQMAEDMDCDALATQRTAIIKEYVWNMGKPCGPILREFFWNHSNMTEIAEICGYNGPDTAKAKKAQCQKTLKNAIRNIFNQLGIGY